MKTFQNLQKYSYIVLFKKKIKWNGERICLVSLNYINWKVVFNSLIFTVKSNWNTEGLNRPILMAAVQSQAETVFSTSRCVSLPGSVKNCFESLKTKPSSNILLKYLRRCGFLEHILKKKCTIDLVPSSVCPSVRLSVPLFSSFLHLESWNLEYKLKTMYLIVWRGRFWIHGLEVREFGLA
jgi:hypothetical protein